MKVSKPVTLFLAVFLLLTLQACKQESEKSGQAGNESCAPLNPNGDSELALIMRKMAKLSEENAAALRNGKDLSPYDGSFDQMLQAKRSMHIEEEFFQGYAKTYLTTLNNLYSCKPEERISFHNNLIKTCQTCHGQTCRGPLKRIDKMMVMNQEMNAGK